MSSFLCSDVLMSEQSLPTACTLSDSELRERRETVLQKVRSAVLAVKEIENGVEYEFASGGEVIMELAHLIDLEHRCCPFLKFQLTIEPGAGAVRLGLTGPEGTKDFLSEIFN
jgi:hypothetical protein